MRYETLSSLSEDEFRRLTGIKPSTFEHMVGILKIANSKKRWHGGRNSKLCIEDQLLMTLEYLREYRTYFHIGTSYGISESSAYKAIRRIEDTLIKHPDFALPGRKALCKGNVDYDVILIDATETPIQRPPKSKNATILERKNSTL